LAQSHQKPNDLSIVYVNVDVLNVREQPTKTAKIIDKLYRNSRQVVSQRQGEWLLIDSEKHATAWIASQYTTSIKPRYDEFIKYDAIRPYLISDPQYAIIKRQNNTLAVVNKNRLIAAYMALDSGKCDLVKKVEVLDSKELIYFIECENKALIKLSDKSIKKGANASNIVTEKEKALPREVARNRCEGKIMNQVAGSDSIKIDPYGISTWITPRGETMVSMTFKKNKSTAKQEESVAICIFRYNDKDSFTITKK